ncbi:unnamed protein product [Spirodela intermedia]|uniref:Auxin-responsive protein n=1 Tax=Spirodela intermedia TaxID=51605 RepID=A0ABN7EAU6_SPIIN|nr:unnamed protein product [Spirodela intermedia]
MPSSVISSHSMHLGVLATASHAVTTGLSSLFFTSQGGFSLRLTSPSEFIVGLNKYLEAKNHKLSVGMRFKMRFEGDEAPERGTDSRCLVSMLWRRKNLLKFSGTIIGVGDCASSHWVDSEWRSLKVQWDEPSSVPRPERVSPWELEPLVSFSSPTVQPAARNKRARPPVHMQGMAVGRAVDLTRLEGYDDFFFKLEEMFGIQGELSGASKKWQVVFTDDEDDMMLVGDDPWHEFCGMVRKIYIYAYEEARRLAPKPKLSLVAPSCEDDEVSEGPGGLDDVPRRPQTGPDDGSPTGGGGWFGFLPSSFLKFSPQNPRDGERWAGWLAMHGMSGRLRRCWLSCLAEFCGGGPRNLPTIPPPSYEVLVSRVYLEICVYTRVGRCFLSNESNASLSPRLLSLIFGNSLSNWVVCIINYCEA